MKERGGSRVEPSQAAPTPAVGWKPSKCFGGLLPLSFAFGFLMTRRHPFPAFNGVPQSFKMLTWRFSELLNRMHMSKSTD